MLNYTYRKLCEKPSHNFRTSLACCLTALPRFDAFAHSHKKRVDSQNALWCPLVIYKANPRKPTIKLPTQSVHDILFIIYYFNGRYNVTISYKG